ncbi:MULTISPECIES: hypothetical protein [Bradyrhizobium]|uniref:hypothetical protein n=1 Tax=Bradyrhizobium TaxID=374 RepID=UPI0026C9DD19|nr:MULTISPECIES: hypothetical protein [Bradyrhizobium]MCP1852053.1 hypothetical protein [Bradyrhizobium sp. USDA 4541]MCP1915965.1 hypothetical protein [Bradyrhizobium elkanii]
MTSKRRRFKQTQSLQERLADEAMRSQAKALSPSAKKKPCSGEPGKATPQPI